MIPHIQIQLKAAEALYRYGKFPEANTAFTKAIELDAKNLKAITRLGEIALHSNCLDEAERRFKEAIQASRGLDKFWPFNAQVKTLLAMTYYRMDRFPEAATLFKEASGPVALGPFRQIRALGQHLALFGDRSPYIIEGPEETRVEFVTTDPLPVITVSVNGSEPLPFFIDTGGAEVVLDTLLAERVGSEVSGTMRGEFAGPKGTVGLGKLHTMKIGEWIIKNVPIHILDTERFAPVFGGVTVKGVVGTRLLMHSLATIDYIKGALVLRHRSEASARKLEAQVGTQKVKVIPFWLIQTHYIVTWGTVNGKGPMLFFVDTGLAGKGFTAPESTLEDAGISPNWTKAQEGLGGAGKVRSVEIVLQKLTLGTSPNEIVEYDVQGVALERPPSVLGDRLGFRIGGLVSHQFFRHYSLTFDFVGMRLFFQGCDQATRE